MKLIPKCMKKKILSVHKKIYNKTEGNFNQSEKNVVLPIFTKSSLDI